jgi:Nickel responsive protein SCO4226-like
MAEFLVELYIARFDEAGAERHGEQARLAAEQLAREGTPIRYLRSIFVPDDETCFYVYEAASPDAVHEAARRAELPSGRVVEAISQPKGTGKEHAC